MAQMFDTVGWFARDLSTLSRVTKVLLPLPDDTVKHPTHVTIPMDCFQILGSPDDHTYQIVNASVAKKFGSHAIDNANLGDFVSDNVPSIGKFIADFSESELPSVPALSVISHVMFSLLRSHLQLIQSRYLYLYYYKRQNVLQISS
jgi:amidase